MYEIRALSARRLAVLVTSLSLAALGAGCTASASVAPAPPASCGEDPSVACDRATGFSCDGAANPEDGDPSLVCSDGTVVPGATLYCCVQFRSSSCAQDDSVVGCTGYSLGFSCTGPDTPDDADPTLVCSQPTPAGGALLYCCTD